MKISVLIPSYRRPDDLTRCLSSLSQQTRFADQICVVARADDLETISAALVWKERLPLEIVRVSLPGVVHAMNSGLSKCLGDIISITDDDAAPRPDWLLRIEALFSSNPKVGALGGRDWVHINDRIIDASSRIVGKVQWYGRLISHHHLGVGPLREVNFLRGVNCSFRSEPILKVGFDGQLRGMGAQVHWEMCLCFALAADGWKIMYDPAVAVDHYMAPRFDRDQRGSFDPIAASNQAYNFRRALKILTPAWLRLTTVIWYELVGSSAEPGVVHLIRALARRDPHAISRFIATNFGRSRK